MTDLSDESPPKKKRTGRTCLGCLVIILLSVCCLISLLLLAPSLLSKLGIFGMAASEVYELAPDPYASGQMSQAFEERNIPGVSVYVIPQKSKATQGAFIILDASKGYTGLSPLEGSDAVFVEILQDLVQRNRAENLRISHVTVDYRDENGDTVLAFTAQQEDVEAYADGVITQDEFFKVVHFDLLDTMRRLGVDEFLEEVQP